ncbi:CD82 antigen-like [Erythrolamprus reginae]|uniref:CD82 antigen-like n=1 Tax=Erythrolamprus reginae TaxID=121349 RepID=UPI00396C4C1A
MGLLIFSVGLWVLITKSAYISILQSFFESVKALVVVFIGIGAAMMFLGLWGSLGFYFGAKFVMVGYIVLLLLIVAVHFFSGFFVSSQNQQMEDKLKKTALNLIWHYNPTDKANQHGEKTWDYLQVQLSCCGWTGPENWENNTFFQHKMGTYPCSCSIPSTSFQPAPGVCRLNTVSRHSGVSDWPVNKQGCGTRVQKRLKKIVDAISLVSFMVIAFEVLGIGLSFYICTGRNVCAVDRR